MEVVQLYAHFNVQRGKYSIFVFARVCGCMVIWWSYLKAPRACSGVVGWGTLLQARKSRFRIPMRSFEFFNWPNLSSRSMALGSTQPLTEMSIWNHSRGWVDTVPDPLLLRKSGGAGNRTLDLWIYSQELWPLDHRGGSHTPKIRDNNKPIWIDM
jgi:hypothetical protein